jgi:hypothetical protein
LPPYSTCNLLHCHLTGRGSGQAKPKPGQSQPLWLGLGILKAKATQSQAKATGFQAKPSQNITTCQYAIQSHPTPCLGFVPLAFPCFCCVQWPKQNSGPAVLLDKRLELLCNSYSKFWFLYDFWILRFGENGTLVSLSANGKAQKGRKFFVVLLMQVFWVYPLAVAL